MTRALLITNCRLYDAPTAAPTTNVLVEGRAIRGVGVAIRQAAEVLDVGGRIIAPGLVDMHVHGAGGGDVLDGTREALEAMARTLARLGTTSFLATTVMRPASGSAHVRVASEAVGTDLGGAELLGIHLEGPFVSLEKRGGLLPAGIYPPSRAALDEVLAITGGTLRVMTVAPELDGSTDVIARLAGRGIIAAFGHSNATYEQTHAGLAAGISHVTHLYNAMAPLHHRAPGPLVAIAETDVTAELVSDGVHVDPRVVAFTYRVLGASRCVCVTDGMRTVGLPDGRYTFAGQPGESRDGTARYLDGTLIGTALGLADVVRRFRRFTGCTLAQAIDAATRIPAAVLGVADRKGAIALGLDADLVVLDDDESVWATVVAGDVVYARDEAAGARDDATVGARGADVRAWGAPPE